MAEEEGKKGGEFSLPSTGLLALTVAVFGLILSGPSQLIDERPASQVESDADAGRIQDIDARMWQDPLGAVVKERKRFSRKHAKGGEAGDHSPQNTVNRAFTNKKEAEDALVLAVMIAGGPYPEEEESRRRQRYAVLSALATQHYAPEETEHIGYFSAGGEREPGEAGCLPEEPIPVPFELFSTAQESAAAGQRVVVLWLDDSRFDRHSGCRVEAVVKQVEFKGVHPKYAVIGPNRSDQLKLLLQEALPPEVKFYAAGATVAESFTGKARDGVFRTIGDDKAISERLVQELELRQIDRRDDHILLISEWDSLYGRSLPETFASAYSGSDAGCQPLELGARGAQSSHVFCVNYMRGIDGLLPKETERTETEQEAKKQEPMQVNNNIDRPSGNNQKDYLRRLVDQVRKLDRQIEDSKVPSPVNNNGITAIGILGSDVYDKLMILQALRPYFPEKIFFTTDLDAAFLTPQELPYTHNLIVGSSYGLSLAPELQMSIPPFRDSYQTATFLSSKLAIARWRRNDMADADVATKLKGFLGEPRIFEIGRKGPVDLSAPQPENADKCRDDVLECAAIHPESDVSPTRQGGWSVRFLKWASLVLGLLLLYRISWRSRGLFQASEDRLRGSFETVLVGEMVSMLPILVAGLIVVGVMYGYVTVIGKEEPFYWLNGVSIWPSNLLQLSALILALLSFWKMQKMLRKAEAEIEEEFALVSAEEAALAETEKAAAARAPTARERGVHVLSVDKWTPPASGGKIDIKGLWQDYQTYGAHRVSRAVINAIFFVAFGFAAVMLSGGLPVPSRGNVAFWGDVVLELLCVGMVVFLIMWVVDGARLASRLIEHIAGKQQTDWPEMKDPKWGWREGEEAHVAYWLDVRFVGRYTRAIEKFIWFPIPSMLLLGIARSSVFDNWTFSAGLFAAIGILLCYLFSTVFLLQHGAKRMRAKAAETLDGKLKGLRGALDSDEQKIAQLELMIAEVKANDEGAFTPFMHQPVVQALLALLSGSGGAAVLLEHPFF